MLTKIGFVKKTEKWVIFFFSFWNPCVQSSVSCMIWIAREDSTKYKFVDPLFSFFDKGFQKFWGRKKTVLGHFWPLMNVVCKNKSHPCAQNCALTKIVLLKVKKIKKIYWGPPWLHRTPKHLIQIKYIIWKKCIVLTLFSIGKQDRI